MDYQAFLPDPANLRVNDAHISLKTVWLAEGRGQPDQVARDFIKENTRLMMPFLPE